MLVMRLVRRPDGAPAGPAAKPVDPAGSSIGRSPECDLVLDDPLRLVSRRHAWLVPSGPREGIVHCVSASASLTVNGRVVPPGGECAVAEGDHLGIGAFELVIEAHVDMDATRIEPARQPVAVPPRPQPPPAPPLPFRVSRLDQFFDLDTVADPLGPGSPLAAAEPVAAPPEALRRTEIRPPARAVPPRMAPTAPAAVAGVDIPVTVEPPRDDIALALREAFLRGAGLDRAALASDPQWAEQVGALLRRLTEGTFELLRSRAATKQTIRATGTRIVARRNNPLKFAPDAAEGLRLLLEAQTRPGFLEPMESLHDAFEDLQLHQLAMVAGMRAAAAELIQRLGPAAVERELGPPRGLARWFPALRDAALWRRHRENHGALVAQLDDAFEAAFGREFVAAYEAQARRVGARPDALEDMDHRSP